MRITNYCRKKCKHFSDRCLELETTADRKGTESPARQTLCWCCKWAGTKCKRYEDDNPLSENVTMKRCKAGGDATVVVVADCPNFVRG